ncbi:MAG: hypothetical protein PWP23_1844 [Candidatus Sumerlaeota bacterium]|nr:hypothetical protein [Candidatus Sumerlaeota bacterium]
MLRTLTFVLCTALFLASGCGGKHVDAVADEGGAVQEARLTAMAYNIRVGAGDAVTKPAPPHDETLRAIAKAITDSGADIVLLQEVDNGVRRSGGTDQAALLAAETGMHHAFAEALPLQGGSYGVALLSRWPIRSTEVLRLPFIDYAARGEDKPAYFSEPRVALAATLDTPHGTVIAISTHLGLTGEQRKLQTARIAEYVAAQDPAVPVLLAGDFNAAPDSPALLGLRALMHEAFAQCSPGVFPPTFPSHKPDRTIDYLFVRGGGAEFESVRVLPLRLSDHCPVEAVLSWKSAE